MCQPIGLEGSAIDVLTRSGIDQWQQGQQRIDQAQHHRTSGTGSDLGFIEIHRGVGKAATNIDRAAQGHRAGVLGLGDECQVQRFLAKINAAGAQKRGDLRVKYQGLDAGLADVGLGGYAYHHPGELSAGAAWD